MSDKIRFIIKSVNVHPKVNFNSTVDYKIVAKLRELYNKNKPFEIDDFLDFLTLDNLKEEFIEKLAFPYHYLFKVIDFDYESHKDRKSKIIKNINDFKFPTYSFHFLSDYYEVIKEDEETITILIDGLKKSFVISDLKKSKIEIDPSQP